MDLPRGTQHIRIFNHCVFNFKASMSKCKWSAFPCRLTIWSVNRGAVSFKMKAQICAWPFGFTFMLNPHLKQLDIDLSDT